MLDRRWMVFIVVTALLLASAAWWSRENNCREWEGRLRAAAGGAGLILIGGDGFERLFAEVGPVPAGCDYVGGGDNPLSLRRAPLTYGRAL